MFSSIAQRLDGVPGSKHAKIFWARMTFSRITIIYFAFSLLHCLVQLIFQFLAFSINVEAAAFLTSIINQADVNSEGFTVLESDGLHFCETLPTSISTETCPLVFSFQQGRSQPPVVANTGGAVVAANVSQVAAGIEPLNASTEPESDDSDSSDEEGESSDEEGGEEEEEEEEEEESSSGSVSATSTGSATASASPVVTPPASVAPPVVLSANVGHASSWRRTRKRSTKKRSYRVPGTPRKRRSTKSKKRDFELEFAQITAVDFNGTTNVVIDGLGWDRTAMVLDRSCLVALNWPVEKLDNTKREDFTFIAFQFWLLGMSIVAVMNESMPHVIASLLTHVLATAWGAFQIAHTAGFRRDFRALTTDGACHPINLLPRYWAQRSEAEIPSLTLNVLALIISAFLSWRLIRLYGWQTFKRVGASRRVNRVYKLVLSLSITIQLSTFFIVVSIALWVDQCFNGAQGRLGKHSTIYKTVTIIILVFLPMWLTLGWYSVRQERRIPMIVFLVMSLAYVAGLGVFFLSNSFRWTFVQWTFYSLITSLSVILTLSTLILGVMCFINFGTGLARFLHAQEALEDNDFGPEFRRIQTNESEKVGFPSTTGPIPSYSVAFGKGEEVPAPTQMFGAVAPGSVRLGPRFNNAHLTPFEPQPQQENHLATFQDQPRARSDSSFSESSITSEKTLDTEKTITRPAHARMNSFDSRSSGRSVDSHASDRTVGSINSQNSKRWVIE